MAIIIGCCIIAAVILYVGHKLGRMLYIQNAFLEAIGRRGFGNWPSDDEWKRSFDIKD